MQKAELLPRGGKQKTVNAVDAVVRELFLPYLKEIIRDNSAPCQPPGPQAGLPITLPWNGGDHSQGKAALFFEPHSSAASTRLLPICFKSASYLLRKDVSCDSFIALITLPVRFAWLQAVIAMPLPLKLPSLVPDTLLMALLLCLSPAACAAHAASIPSHPASMPEAWGINSLPGGVGTHHP